MILSCSQKKIENVHICVSLVWTVDFHKMKMHGGRKKSANKEIYIYIYGALHLMVYVLYIDCFRLSKCFGGVTEDYAIGLINALNPIACGITICFAAADVVVVSLFLSILIVGNVTTTTTKNKFDVF